jgi:hypothetical protein
MTVKIVHPLRTFDDHERTAEAHAESRRIRRFPL